MEIPPKLKEYIDNNRSVYRDSLSPITDPDEPLQIDSLGLIRLVVFLENEFGYRIEDEELIADNFATLRQIGQLLATKTPTGPTPEAKLPWAGGALPAVSKSANAVGYAQFYSRAHRTVIRIYDEAGNVIVTHEHAGEFKEW